MHFSAALVALASAALTSANPVIKRSQTCSPQNVDAHPGASEISLAKQGDIRWRMDATVGALNGTVDVKSVVGEQDSGRAGSSSTSPFLLIPSGDQFSLPQPSISVCVNRQNGVWASADCGSFDVKDFPNFDINCTCPDKTGSQVCQFQVAGSDQCVTYAGAGRPLEFAKCGKVSKDSDQAWTIQHLEGSPYC
ncbi:hypothetical protein JCM8202_001160 [Rhodotorula sphaerocarpa]